MCLGSPGRQEMKQVNLNTWLGAEDWVTGRARGRVIWIHLVQNYCFFLFRLVTAPHPPIPLIALACGFLFGSSRRDVQGRLVIVKKQEGGNSLWAVIIGSL